MNLNYTDKIRIKHYDGCFNGDMRRPRLGDTLTCLLVGGVLSNSISSRDEKRFVRFLSDHPHLCEDDPDCTFAGLSVFTL